MANWKCMTSVGTL